MRSAGFMPKSHLVKVAKCQGTTYADLSKDDVSSRAAVGIAGDTRGRGRTTRARPTHLFSARCPADLRKVAKCQSTTIGDRWSLPRRRVWQPARCRGAVAPGPRLITLRPMTDRYSVCDGRRLLRSVSSFLPSRQLSNPRRRMHSRPAYAPVTAGLDQFTLAIPYPVRSGKSSSVERG